jgi:serine/threonine protein kinase
MKLLVRKKDAAGNRVTFFVEVSLTSTGAEIKEIVAKQTKVPVAAQQLTYTKVDPVTGEQQQVQLEAEVTVEEAGLADQTILNLDVIAVEEEKSAVKTVRAHDRDLRVMTSQNWLAQVLECCAAGGLPQLLNTLSEYERVESLAEEHEEILSVAGPQGWTCLHVSCLKGHTEITKFLVDRRASCNKETEDYWTPLQLACYIGNIECNPNIGVRALLDHPAILVNKLTRGVASPLHLAANQGHPEIISLLFEKGGSLIVEDQQGRIPLEVASTHGVIELIPRIMGEMMLQRLTSTDTTEVIASYRGCVMQTSVMMINDRRVLLDVDVLVGVLSISTEAEELLVQIPLLEVYDVRLTKTRSMQVDTRFLVDSKQGCYRFYTDSREESEEWVLRLWAAIKHCLVKKIGFTPAEQASFLSPPTPPQSFAEASVKDENIEDEVMVQKGEEVSYSSFDVLELLGEGSFGKVYKVVKKNSGKVMAMKVLSKKFLQDNGQLKYAISECKIMRAIKHPFILKLHFAFQTKKNLYIVLEFCPNGDLMNHLSERTRFGESVTRFYICQVILALEHLHAQDIVYRDLKPENILIDRKGNIRLADFGLAKENVNPLNPAMSFCGSPAYLAPELLSKRGSDKSADVYSVGAMMYEMLTGFPPFFSENMQELFRNIKRGNLQFTKTVKPDAQDLIRRLMNQDPSMRPTPSNLKKHPFFAEVDWEKVYLKQVRPPRLGPGWPQAEDDADTGENVGAQDSQSPRKSLSIDAADVSDASEHVEGFDFISK